MLGIQGEGEGGERIDDQFTLAGHLLCIVLFLEESKSFGWYRRKSKGGAADLPPSVRESNVCPVYITGGETLRRAICNWGSSGLTSSTTLPYYYYYRKKESKWFPFRHTPTTYRVFVLSCLTVVDGTVTVELGGRRHRCRRRLLRRSGRPRWDGSGRIGLFD